jgi:carbamate kinase
MATDADAVFTDWGTPKQKAIHKSDPTTISKLQFPAGSMGPKVDAACRFATTTGHRAAIGALKDIPAIVRGDKGTVISTTFGGMTWHS